MLVEEQLIHRAPVSFAAGVFCCSSRVHPRQNDVLRDEAAEAAREKQKESPNRTRGSFFFTSSGARGSPRLLLHPPFFRSTMTPLPRFFSSRDKAEALSSTRTGPRSRRTPRERAMSTTKKREERLKRTGDREMRRRMLLLHEKEATTRQDRRKGFFSLEFSPRFASLFL